MRGALPLGLALALGATGGLAVLVLREAPGPEAAPPAGEPPAAAVAPAAAEPVREIRPYRTTQTLAEDLRDALAGDPARLGAELWAVSAALEERARWVLVHQAAEETSPRVRALLVLAAGVHLPEDPRLLEFLGDREPRVRAAAALAAAYRKDGARRAELLGVGVPLGEVREGARASVERARDGEQDAEARAAMEAALSARR